MLLSLRRCPSRADQARRPRLRRKVPRLRSSQLEFTLQVGLCDFDVSHRHFWRGMAKQFHQRGETHTRAQHFSRVCVSKLVWNDADRQVDGGTYLVQIITKLTDERLLAVWSGSRYRQAARRPRSERKRSRWTISQTNESTGPSVRFLVSRVAHGLPTGLGLPTEDSHTTDRRIADADSVCRLAGMHVRQVVTV